MHRITFILLLLIISCSSPTENETVCSGTVDCAGACDGTATTDCEDTCNGTATIDCAGTCGGTVTTDCAGTCGGTAMEDCLEVCGGTAPAVADLTTGCDFPTSQTTAYIKLLDNGKVIYSSPQDIGGYQFVVDGAAAGNTVSLSGGDAETAGLDPQSQYNTTDGYLVLGFSISGATIAAGCGVLTELTTSDFQLTSISAQLLSTPLAGPIVSEIYCTGN